MRKPFPLQWPTERPRTPLEERETAQFRVTLSEAVDDLLYELHQMQAGFVVITSDLPSRNDGLPYSNAKCDDPGIAVWCVVDGRELVFACDHWNRPAANARAIGKTIEALRGIKRWGSTSMVSQAFAGFAALPPANPADIPDPLPPADPADIPRLSN